MPGFSFSFKIDPSKVTKHIPGPVKKAFNAAAEVSDRVDHAFDTAGSPINAGRLRGCKVPCDAELAGVADLPRLGLEHGGGLGGRAAAPARSPPRGRSRVLCPSGRARPGTPHPGARPRPAQGHGPRVQPAHRDRRLGGQGQARGGAALPRGSRHVQVARPRRVAGRRRNRGARRLAPPPQAGRAPPDVGVRRRAPGRCELARRVHRRPRGLDARARSSTTAGRSPSRSACPSSYARG